MNVAPAPARRRPAERPVDRLRRALPGRHGGAPRARLRGALALFLAPVMAPVMAIVMVIVPAGLPVAALAGPPAAGVAGRTIGDTGTTGGGTGGGTGAALAGTDAARGSSDATRGSPPHGLDLSAYAGKVVYVDFWASWCTPCRAAFPWMNALQRELGDEGLVVVGVNTGDTAEEAARFLESVPAEFTLVDDVDGSIAEAYGLRGMPTAYVHDRDGELVERHVGFDERSAEARAEELRALVRASR